MYKNTENQTSALIKQVIIPTILGNFLEWYDFATYAFLATIIAAQFFPEQNPSTALLSSFAIFAIGYFARPIGGILAGHFGDRYSRYHTLIFTLLFMGLTTALMGIVPNYQTWGIAAPITLTILRLLQGLAVGGEYPGSTVILVEAGQPHHQGFFSTQSLVGAILGMTAGSTIIAILTHFLGETALKNWAWRLPFLLGLVLAFIGLYIRLKLWRTTPNVKLEKPHRFPILPVLTQHYKKVAQSFLIFSPAPVYSTIASTFFPTFLQHFLHYSATFTFRLLTVNDLCLAGVYIFSGWLADRQQRYISQLKKHMLLLAALTIPIFLLIFSGKIGCIIGFITLSCYGAIAFGSLLVATSQLFPSEVRYTGFALTQGLSFSLLAGTGPLLLTWLIHCFGLWMPATYLILTCLLSALTLWRIE